VSTNPDLGITKQETATVMKCSVDWSIAVLLSVKWSIAVRRRLTATGTHVPYGITQYYQPPGRGDIPAFTPAEADTRLSDPGGMQG